MVLKGGNVPVTSRDFAASRRFRGVVVSVLLLAFVPFSAFCATVTYTEDMTDFPNPERGFWGGTISKKYIYISTHGTLPQTFLDGVEKLFNDTRTAKKKIIPRFRYNSPDAPLEAMLAQIEQLRPVFARHYDVIALLEAGFIGAYGEWHSSPNFKTTDTNGRRQVLFKLLDVLPKERMVCLRYNTDKRAIFRSNAPITIGEAFDGSNKSRTGATNDCFVTNETDAGTYHSTYNFYGLGYEAEKQFLSADNLYAPQEGETCQVGSTSYATCERALADMARMRWDMIQTGWYGPVLTQWKNQGCWDEISRRLGYRIVLIDGTFDDDVTDGNLDATLRLKNVGFGKIYNPRKLEMVLRNTSNGSEYVLPIPQDPRFWSPGSSQTVPIKLAIPEAVPFGTYSLYLSLQDPAPKLYGIPEYAIRLANQNVWESSKGYNSLRHTVKIGSHGTVLARNRVFLQNEFRIRAVAGNTGKGSVEIFFNTTKPGVVRIDVHNLSGSLVTNLADRYFDAGAHHLRWNEHGRAGRVQPAGVYFVTLRSQGQQERYQLLLR